MKMNPYPLGAYPVEGGVRFSFVSEKAPCGVVICERSRGKQIRKIAFGPRDRVGNVYCKIVPVEQPEEIAYYFYEEKQAVADPYARGFHRRLPFGAAFDARKYKAVVTEDSFDWEDDSTPYRRAWERVVYCLHVRGFTKHTSSGVEQKGTFAGVADKLPYLWETGVTTLELQPVYEFTEADNYWGYAPAFYYAPKSSYAMADAADELKQLVKACHKFNMEVVLQMYFPREIPRSMIGEVLRYWKWEYHVDGFRLKGENLPMELLSQDPLLADCLLWCDESDEYQYQLRKFMKGEWDSLKAAIYQMTYLPKEGGRVHYLSNYHGFTLHDMFAYEEKHNEANGEENRDGTDYNCSWNCGEEGPTKKKKILELRKQCIKNAMCLLLASASTPLLFMGDEFGNSQGGNNNPYNQDNLTTWLNWNDLERNRELYDFWKEMAGMRKMGCFSDFIGRDRQEQCSLGYPLLSCHGAGAWQLPEDSGDCFAGVLFCRDYVQKAGKIQTDVRYLGMNMNACDQTLALPRLPEGYRWQRMLATAVPEESELEKIKPEIGLPARSVAIYCGVKDVK